MPDISLCHLIILNHIWEGTGNQLNKMIEKMEKNCLTSNLLLSDNDVFLQGAAVTLTELGEYTKAASRLEELIKVVPSTPVHIKQLFCAVIISALWTHFTFYRRNQMILMYTVCKEM